MTQLAINHNLSVDDNVALFERTAAAEHSLQVAMDMADEMHQAAVNEVNQARSRRRHIAEGEHRTAINAIRADMMRLELIAVRREIGE